MSAPTEHKDCRGLIKRLAAEAGTDIVVSTARPLVASPYGANSFTCPHGTEYFIEPSGEQIAQWTRDGVA